MGDSWIVRVNAEEVYRNYTIDQDVNIKYALNMRYSMPFPSGRVSRLYCCSFLLESGQ
jgi:hypothetical protein